MKNSKDFGSNSRPPTEEEVEEYEMLLPLLKPIINEVKELSKKKQDGALNLVKVKIINKILMRIKQILRNEPTNDYIEPLDEDVLPTNSDAVFMLVHFESAMNQFRDKYKSYGSWDIADEEA